MSRSSTVGRGFTAARAALLGAGAALGATMGLMAGPTSVAGAAVPGCSTSGLVIWLYVTPGGAAAGSAYYDLEFTNLSGHSCWMSGYPGVSAVDLSGDQLGLAASRDPAHTPHKVTIKDNASAIAIVQVVDVGNFPTSSCHPVAAAGFRVYPPGQTAAKVAPFPFNACSAGTSAVFLHVEALQSS